MPYATRAPLAELKPAGFWSLRFFLASLWVLLGGLAISARSAATGYGVVPGLAAMAAATAILVLANVRRGQSARIVAHGDRSIELPLPYWFGRRNVHVQDDAFYAIDLARNGRTLVLGVAGWGPFALHQRDLSRGDLRTLAATLREHAGTRLERAEALAETAHARPVIAAGVLVMILVLAHFGLSLLDDTLGDRMSALFVAGGLNGGLLATGEWHRLVTSGLLHGSLAHLLTNCALIGLIAWRTEYLWPVRDFLAAFIVAVITGSALASLGSAELIVGASGGVSGLFGLWVYRLLQARYHLPARTQMASSSAIILAGLAAVLAPLPNVSVLTHAGGFIGGLAVAPLLHGSRRAIRVLIATATAVALVAAIAGAFSSGRSWLGEGGARALALIAIRPDDGPLVHLLAWYLSFRAEVSAEELAWAIDRLRDTGLDSDDVDETYARLFMRIGDHDRTIAAARRSLLRALDPDVIELLVAAERKHLQEHCEGGDDPATALTIGQHSAGVSGPFDEVHLEVRTRSGHRWYVSVPVGEVVTHRRILEVIQGAREVRLAGGYPAIDGRTWSFSGPTLAESFSPCAPRVPVTRLAGAPR